MTIGNTVFYNIDLSSNNDVAKWTSLGRHESSHVGDYESQGCPGWYPLICRLGINLNLLITQYFRKVF